MFLTRAQMFAMPDRSRATVYRNRLATAKIQHARRSAKQVATFLMAPGVVDGSLHYRGRCHANGTDWGTLDAIALSGYRLGVQNQLRTTYGVHPGLLNYASGIVANMLGANVEITAPSVKVYA